MTVSRSHRFSRQEALAEVGKAGQALLKKAKVLCVGAGGLGSPAALYLAAAGVGTLGIVDFDRVESSNLQRQILFTEADLGQSKAELAASRLKSIHSDLEVCSYPEKLTAQNALELMSGYDLVIDGTDNFNAKYVINDAAAILGIPVVFGAISRWEGQISVFWARKGPCYRCLYPEPPRVPVLNCAEAGIMGAVAGVFGSLQAVEAIKVILSSSDPSRLEPLVGRLWILDTTDMRSVSIKVEKRSDCPVCQVRPEQIRLEDVLDALDAPDACAMSVAGNDLLNGDGLDLIDVREEEEWNEGHIPGARHWPLSRLLAGSLPEKLSSSQDQRTVLYCASGVRSFRALKILKDNGWMSVTHLSDGIRGWKGELSRASSVA
jgi:adenylyltransferase/sulfurtransferase